MAMTANPTYEQIEALQEIEGVDAEKAQRIARAFLADSAEERLSGQIEKLDTKFEAKFDRLDDKIDALDKRFNSVHFWIAGVAAILLIADYLMRFLPA